MENFEEEYRSRMDSLCSKVDVLDYIRSNAYKNVTKARKLVSKPLRSVLATTVSIVLICCILFVVSLNRTSPIINNDISTNSSFDALNSNVHLKYSDEVKFYNITKDYEDSAYDFTYIGNDRIVMSFKQKITNDAYKDCDAIVYDLNTKKIIKKLTFEKGLTLLSHPEKYQNNGFLYINFSNDIILYDIYDNDGNFIKRINLLEDSSYSNYDLSQVNKILKGHDYNVNNNGVTIYQHYDLSSSTYNLLMKNTKTKEIKNIITVKDDGSENFRVYWFIDDNNILIMKKRDLLTTNPIFEFFSYNIKDNTFKKINFDKNIALDFDLIARVNGKNIGLEVKQSGFELTGSLYNVSIEDEKAIIKNIWTSKTGEIISYDYSDNEKVLAILSRKNDIFTITLFDTDTFEPFYEKSINITSDKNLGTPELSLLSDGTIVLKFLVSNGSGSNDLLLYKIEPKK